MRICNDMKNISNITKLSNKRILVEFDDGHKIVLVPVYHHSGDRYDHYTSMYNKACGSCAAAKADIYGSRIPVNSLTPSLCSLFSFSLCNRVGVEVNKIVTRFKSVSTSIGLNRSLYFKIYLKHK